MPSNATFHCKAKPHCCLVWSLVGRCWLSRCSFAASRSSQRRLLVKRPMRFARLVAGSVDHDRDRRRRSAVPTVSGSAEDGGVARRPQNPVRSGGEVDLLAANHQEQLRRRSVQRRCCHPLLSLPAPSVVTAAPAPKPRTAAQPCTPGRSSGGCTARRATRHRLRSSPGRARRRRARWRRSP